MLARRQRGGGVVIGIPCIDSVEEALCFGWIDSTIRRVGGEHFQRFTPRRDRNRWTHLNLARCRRPESMGLMTDAGREVYPGDMGFSIDPEVVEVFFDDSVATVGVMNMPLLYVMVRIGNIQIKHGIPLFVDRLERFLGDCRKGLVHGRWVMTDVSIMAPCFVSPHMLTSSAGPDQFFSPSTLQSKRIGARYVQNSADPVTIKNDTWL